MKSARLNGGGLNLTYRNQRRNDALSETLNLLFLALAALDYISETMGLGVGASPAETIAHLASICKDMDPALGQERALAAARRVIGALENRDANGNDHAFRITYWTASVFAERVFLRLVDVHEDRAEAVYVMSPDGLLACLAILDADLQALLVDELLVERAMQRGRIPDASVLARRARKRSIELRLKNQAPSRDRPCGTLAAVGVMGR